MNFGSREMKFSSRRRGTRVIRVRVNRVKMTERWSEIQGKLNLVQVSGKFELSEFYGSYVYSCGSGGYHSFLNMASLFVSD